MPAANRGILTDAIHLQAGPPRGSTGLGRVANFTELPPHLLPSWISHECAAALFSNPTLLPYLDIVVPSPTLVYIIHFNHCLATVSGLYGVLSRYKQAMASAGNTRGFTEGEGASIQSMNGYTHGCHQLHLAGQGVGSCRQDSQRLRDPTTDRGRTGRVFDQRG